MFSNWFVSIVLLVQQQKPRPTELSIMIWLRRTGCECYMDNPDCYMDNPDCHMDNPDCYMETILIGGCSHMGQKDEVGYYAE